MNNIQISELLETLDIQDNSVFPVVFQGNTKKISFKTLKEAIINKSVTGFKIEVVEELPPRGDKYTIYFAKNIDNEYYSEFLFYNNEWIKVGDTALQKDADILYKQGTNIFVNTAEMLINLGIDGYYKQEKRDGYNVLNNELTSQEINGIRVVVNEDGSILLNGQSTQRTILTLKENIKLEDGKPYRLSGAPLNSNETNYYLQINQEYNDTDHKATDYGTGMNFTYTEYSENSNSIYIVIENDVELNNVIFRPMVSIGTDSRLFEKYGKTPSLDFPSEMNFATGTKEINISNKKNLYNRNSIDVENAYLTSDNKVVNAVGWYITDFIEIEANQFYILNNVIGDIQSACIYDNNKNLIGNLDNYNNRSQITFEAPIHSKYIKLSVNTNIDILELYLQQEFSMQNKSQTYEVHLEDLVLKGNENVRDTFIENDFTFYEVESIGYKEFDGTEEWELIEVGDKTLFAISIENIKSIEEPMLNDLISNMFTETIYSELAEYSEAEMLQTLDNKVIFYTSKIDTLEDWQEYLSNNILQLAYPLETPIVKEITNKTLIKDLTKIKNQAKSYKNRTYVDSDKTIYFDLAYTTGNQDVGNMIADRTIDNAVKVARIQEILPTKANEVETANKLQMTVDNTTYVLTVKLLNKDNEIISEKEVDLPIEAMVVDGEYDPETKEVVLTLQSGQEVRFSVADLVSGLASQYYVDTELEKKVDKVEGKDLISNADKTKLDGIEENANNYTLPTASSDTKGGIQVGYIQNEKKYPVQLDENGNAYVNVPWEGNELVAQEVVDARGEFNTLGKRLNNVDKNIIISTKPFETDCFIEDSANSKIKFDKIIGGLVQEGEPSLSNPSEVKYVSGNYDIKVSNNDESKKQIYPVDLSNRNILNLIDGVRTNQGVTSTINNQKINSTGTATATYADINPYTNLFNIEIKQGHSYIFKISKVLPFNIVCRFMHYNSSQAVDFSQDIRILSGETSVKFTANHDYLLYYLFYEQITPGQSVQIEDLGLMIAESTQELEYQPYVAPYNYSLYSDKDYIYKKDGKWYVHNEYTLFSLSNLTWVKDTNGNRNRYSTYAYQNVIRKATSNGEIIDGYSNIEKPSSANLTYLKNNGFAVDPSGTIWIYNESVENITTEEFKNKMTELNAYIISKLATPTETEIQGESAVVEAELLYTQLEAIANMKTYKAGTHITFDDVGKIQGEYVVDNGLAEAVQEFNEINGYVDEARVIELIKQYK